MHTTPSLPEPPASRFFKKAWLVLPVIQDKLSCVFFFLLIRSLWNL